MNRILITLLSLLTFMSMEASTMIADWRNYGGVKKTYTETKSFTAKQGDILQCQCSGVLQGNAYLKLYLTVNGIKKELVSYDSKSNLPNKNYKILFFQLTEDNNYTLTYEYYHAGGGTAYGAHARAYLISVAESDYNTPLSDGDEFHLDGFHYKYSNNGLYVCQCSYYQYDGDIVIPTTITYRGGSYVVKGIENEAFYKCTGISTVYLNDSISTMGSSVFERCTSLNEVNLSTNLTSIGDRLFLQCNNLTSVVIPSNITNIGTQAFYGCNNLLSVTSYAQTPPTVVSDVFYVYGDLYVPKGTKEAYKAADVWKNFNIIEMEDEAIYQKGDVNHDGSVTMADANLVVNYFLANDKTTFVGFDIVAADVNEDGYISMADANAIVNMFLGTGQ